MLQDFSKTIHVENLLKTESWWSYDFGISSIEMDGHGTSGKTRPLINKINCYVKFIGENNTAYIYEQIYLSDKFPNNHQYKYNVKVDESKLVKVWDIDNCLKKLNIKEK